MNADTWTRWLGPALLAAYFGWRFLKFRAAAARLPELIKRGAVVVDVRGPEEFASGAAPGSVNIPLPSLERRHRELAADKPVVVCCASGARSALAAAALRRLGFQEVVNVGSWTNAARALGR